MLAVAFLAFVMASLARDVWPDFMKTLSEGNNPYIMGASLGGAALLFWIIGLVIGRSTTGPRA